MAKRMRFILSTIMVIVAMTAKAQVTTSSLSGKVTDPDKGSHYRCNSSGYTRAFRDTIWRNYKH